MPIMQGTQTEKNLLAAFAGESQAAMRYSFFAKKAKKEGFEQAAALFSASAEDERAHASAFFKQLAGGMAEIHATYPAGGNGTTVQNLRAAAEGEHEEWARIYPSFAETARQEGFPIVAQIFEATASIEQHHESRYRTLLERIETGTFFKRPESVVWRCRNCGYLHKGTEAPETCVACGHPQAYFETYAGIA